MKKEAILILPTEEGGTKEIHLPLLEGTMGPQVIDIRHLYPRTGFFTHDPGFTSTSSCESHITYIDGENGTLLYRGYPIEDVVRQNDFMDATYLLLSGELPTPDEKKVFVDDIKNHTLLHDQIVNFFSGFRRDAHPMAILVGVTGALSAFYHDVLDVNDPVQRGFNARRMIAKVPTIAAMAYKYSIGQPFMYPQNHYHFAENFLHMMFSVPSERYQVNPVLAKALDRIFILHADHEQNASTSTVRLAASSGANPFACIAAGMSSLWGPAHGGANEAVLKMLQDIGSKDRIPEYIQKAKDKNDPFRLMGFGHRVYKNHDPRAKVLRETCHEVLDELGVKKDPIFDLALELERIALEDKYFIEKKLYPNVDFYSGIIFKAIGIPISMFTVIFSVARTVGWVAQWHEMMGDTEDRRIGRPRQLYKGPTQR